MRRYQPHGIELAIFVRKSQSSAFRLGVGNSPAPRSGDSVNLECALVFGSIQAHDTLGSKLLFHGFECTFGCVLLCIGLDGWVQLINQHPAYDGMHFTEASQLEEGIPQWIECTIHRKDRSIPLSVREYFTEVKRDSSAWTTHPRRMLRHKAMVQCARLSFSLPTLQSIVDHDDLLKMQNLKPPAKDQLSSQEVKHTVSACQETLTEPRPNSRPLSASEYQGVDESHSFNCEDSNAVLYAQKSRKESRASWATPRGPSSRQALIERLEGSLYHL